MAKHVWKFVKSKKIFIVLLILYTVVFILAVRFIFHILPILLGGLLGWITAPLCRLLEKRLHLQGTVKTILLLPAVFLTLTLIPVFAYLTLLYRENLLSLLKKLIGEKYVENLQKSTKSESSVGFVSAYALIYTITFAESFVMLHLLRMEYPLMTAAVVTVSDIFPVFGPGTVLLPLAVYRLLCGSAAQALGLFIGWIILSVIRQIIEPKLLAKMTRTPPAVMLFAVYCSLISRNFWLIPYTGTFFMLIGMLKKAGILTAKSKSI